MRHPNKSRYRMVAADGRFVAVCFKYLNLPVRFDAVRCGEDGLIPQQVNALVDP